MTPYTKLYLLLFLCVFQKTSYAVDVTCEYDLIPELLNVEGPQYGCILKSDFLFTAVTSVGVLGTHTDGKTDTSVILLAIDDKKVLQIPDVSKKFTKLIYIKISNTTLRHLQKWNLAVYKDTLEHLVIKKSKVEIIDKDLFEDFEAIKTIDLQENKIFYIADNVFDGLENTLKYLLLEKNECKDAAGNEGAENFTPSLGSFSGAIAKIASSKCKFSDIEAFVVNYQKFGIAFDSEVYKKLDGSEKLTDTQANILELKETQLGDALKNLREKTELYDGVVIEIDALKVEVTTLTDAKRSCESQAQSLETEKNNLMKKADQLQARVEILESTAEKCLEVDGTCRYTTDGTYGYSCIAHNISVTTKGIEISWTGTHSPTTQENRNVMALIIRDLSVQFMPSKIGDTFLKLKTLIIKSCKLSKLSTGDFLHLEDVETIEIKLNEITSIDAGVFDPLKTLKTLDLSENKIQSLPSKSFALLTALKTLNLNSNQLTTIRADSVPTTNVIENFSATNNKLATVESSFVWRMRNAKLIDFRGNGCNYKFDLTAEDDFIDFYTNILTKC